MPEVRVTPHAAMQSPRFRQQVSYMNHAPPESNGLGVCPIPIALYGNNRGQIVNVRRYGNAHTMRGYEGRRPLGQSGPGCQNNQVPCLRIKLYAIHRYNRCGTWHSWRH